MELETKDASAVAAKSIFASAVAIGLCSFAGTILFLFCAPSIDKIEALVDVPQPFVPIYIMALGRGGGTFMTVLAALQLVFCNAIQLLATSRLLFALARDDVLPFSDWIRGVSLNGCPRNAVTLMYIICALMLCTILPSASAFTSLVSGGVAPMVASYGLIALLRLIMRRDDLPPTKFSLGRASKMFYTVSVAFNMFLLVVNVSPFIFPVTTKTLNFAGVIFGAITILGILSFLFIPKNKWLHRERMHTSSRDKAP